MQVHWMFDGCDLDDQRRIEAAWESWSAPLEGRVAALTDQPQELRIAVEYSDDESQAEPEWQVQAVMHRPGQTLAVEGNGRQLEEALSDVVHGLAQAIDEQEDIPERVTRLRQGVEAVLPFLDRSREASRSDVFTSFLQPLMYSFASFVHRELQVREAQGELLLGDVTAPDVLDDALIAAWEQFPRRPQSLPLDLWLLQLVNDVLDKHSNQVRMQSLHDEVTDPEQLLESSSDQQNEWESYAETVELAELLPGTPGADLWDDLDREAKDTRLTDMLGQLPREQRQVLLLNAVSGYSATEIADFEGTSVDQVHHDLAVARQTLDRYFRDRMLPELEQLGDHPGGRARRRRRR